MSFGFQTEVIWLSRVEGSRQKMEEARSLELIVSPLQGFGDYCQFETQGDSLGCWG